MTSGSTGRSESLTRSTTWWRLVEAAATSQPHARWPPASMASVRPSSARRRTRCRRWRGCGRSQHRLHVVRRPVAQPHRARPRRRWRLRAAACSGSGRSAAVNAALKRRTLAKPLTSATCVTGRSVSASSCLAVSRRRVCRYCSGETPKRASKMRRRWRSLMPSRCASRSTEGARRIPGFRLVEQRAACCASTSLASWIDQRGACGASSGRQRRQGRKPAHLGLRGVGEEAAVLALGRAHRQTGRQ
jgi:hypothetical protein